MPRQTIKAARLRILVKQGFDVQVIRRNGGEFVAHLPIRPHGAIARSPWITPKGI